MTILLFLFIVSCGPGEYFASYLQQTRSIVPGEITSEIIPKCAHCPKNTYQPSKESTKCILCPKYHATVDNGATSIEYCISELLIPIYYIYDAHINVCTNIIDVIGVEVFSTE